MKGRAVGKAGGWGRRAARLLMLLVLAWPAGSASAAPARAKAKPGAAASASALKGASKNVKARPPRRPKSSAASRPVAAAPPAVVPSAEAAPASVEVRVREADPNAVTEVVETKEVGAGVKTYTFGAQEVEGRLRSPQILYFLRRVRAEFDAEPLGHRSFLLELGDTRRHRAFE